MTDSLQEDLLGYALGALDDERRVEVEQYLAEDADARRRLAVLNKALTPLEAARGEYEPPAGLAARTCRFVLGQPRIGRAASPQKAAALVGTSRRAAKARMHAVEPAGAEGGRFHWQDVLMAAGIVVAATVLLLPAIHGSRVQARLLGCQGNLRDLGTALTHYSEYHDGLFPKVPTRGNLAAASAYAPILAANELLPEDRLVVCPGSPLAEANEFRIPSLDEIEAIDSPEQLKTLQQTMGGSYGYSLGHQKDGQYFPTRNLRRENFAIASDAPNGFSPDRLSANHGRLGQNVLFEDGHVRFTSSPRPSEVSGDNFFLNDDGQVAAGIHPNDAVIGAGATPPIQCVGR